MAINFSNVKKIIFFVLINTLLIFPARSETNSLGALLKSKTIRCIVEEGYTSEFNGKKLSFEKGLFAKKLEDRILTFSKIDFENSAAIVIGNAGTDDVIVRPAAIGVNFVSFTNYGAIVIATVFANTDSDGNYFFATSRHTQLPFGNAISMPSQWTGKCKALAD